MPLPGPNDTLDELQQRLTALEDMLDELYTELEAEEAEDDAAEEESDIYQSRLDTTDKRIGDAEAELKAMGVRVNNITKKSYEALLDEGGLRLLAELDDQRVYTEADLQRMEGTLMKAYITHKSQDDNSPLAWIDAFVFNGGGVTQKATEPVTPEAQRRLLHRYRPDYPVGSDASDYADHGDYPYDTPEPTAYGTRAVTTVSPVAWIDEWLLKGSKTK